MARNISTLSNISDMERSSSSSLDDKNKKHIIYIEDNLDNVTLMKYILRDYTDIELTSSIQGKLGYELIESTIPDMIFLDIGLPDISGDIILKQIKENPNINHIPIIIITADVTNTNKLRQRCIEYGCDNFVTKPFNIKTVINIVETYLYSHSES